MSIGLPFVVIGEKTRGSQKTLIGDSRKKWEREVLLQLGHGAPSLLWGGKFLRTEDENEMGGQIFGCARKKRG